ncbi:gametogenetin-binding protein 1-like [Pongo abelii]|uniref:gametogenetin-binding protein 1-like n=1 Tax=Pongo abelii TaxID=9601 RepID=UPI0001D5E7C1|nr:gametogenetin-binding protein 1-like [Pongo abelii]XP_054346214.1 gametogenetin-binding protein 1-like [Pongo pygmaeus]
MEAPALKPRSRILGCSSMFRDQGAISLMMSREGHVGRRKPGPSALLPHPFSVAVPRGFSKLSRQPPLKLGMGGMVTYTCKSKKARGGEVKSVLPIASQEVSGNLPEKEGKEPAGDASRKTGASDSSHFIQILQLKEEYLQRATGPREVSPEASTREKACLFEDLDHPTCCQAVSDHHPIHRRLHVGLFQGGGNSLEPLPQFGQGASKLGHGQGLPSEEKSEEEKLKEEDSSFKFCVPGIAALQSPLNNAFRSTDTVGFLELELKKLLGMQQ